MIWSCLFMPRTAAGLAAGAEQCFGTRLQFLERLLGRSSFDVWAFVCSVIFCGVFLVDVSRAAAAVPVPELSYSGGPGLLAAFSRRSVVRVPRFLWPLPVSRPWLVAPAGLRAEPSAVSQVGPGGAWEARPGILPLRAGGDLGAGRWASARAAGPLGVKGVAPGGAAGGRPGTQ